MAYPKTHLISPWINATPCWTRWLLIFCFAIAHNPAIANEPSQENDIPSFVELEAAGAVFGEIRIDGQDIFELQDPKENALPYRVANGLHIRTRPKVIEDTLLFKSGEPVSTRLIEESERLLRSNRFIYDVHIRPIAYHDGVVDIEVKTRDTWSLHPGFQFSRAGGVNTLGFTIEERNLLGTGASLGLRNISDVDRNGTEFEISDKQAFGGWYNAGYRYAKLSDGKRQSFFFGQPFYALDTRWAAGVSVMQDDRIDPLYNSGILIGQYSHSQKGVEVFGGWSEGLIENRARRYSIGLTYDTNTYGPAANLFPPVQPPPDQRLSAPFFRYEVVEDSYQKLKNRDQIERAEYFAMGFQSSVQIGRALTGLGSSNNLWIYKGSIGNGLEILPRSALLLSASLSGEYWNGISEKHLLNGSARYYIPRSEHTLLFMSVEANAVSNPGIDEQLLLGGDNGLRGYPLRYQSGNKSALLTVERRAYSEWYPFRLFRVGGAMFYDAGRAWGGSMNQNLSNPGWLHDVGFGLRILSARSAFGNVMHADFAFPLNRDSNTTSFQFLLKTKTSF
ncbi:MAG: hypothetical protein A3J49_03735 [Gallionellales bacterium RIFCSPHIGHO2_02_FULL_57_16]|nr:MAG: hypothetical protein A3J49_03735 [Gallionellales bacterium RIFCSPHIGHO2_02_FULL_57_16]